MAKLTEIQGKVLSVIMRSWLKRGKPPIDSEITERTGTRSAKYHVANLQKGGYVSTDGHRRVLRDHTGERIRMECRFRPIIEVDLQIQDDKDV
jgi:hypothetical protein